MAIEIIKTGSGVFDKYGKIISFVPHKCKYSSYMPRYFVYGGNLEYRGHIDNVVVPDEDENIEEGKSDA